jgi:hypothetical protein
MNIKNFAEYDQDRSKHVGVTSNCESKYNFNISAIVGFIA